MQAFMMITALAWPMIGGAVVGLITGIVKGHGLVGTVIDIIAAGLVGFLLTMAFVAVSGSIKIPDELSLPLSLGLPVLGGSIGLWLKGCVLPAKA